MKRTFIKNMLKVAALALLPLWTGCDDAAYKELGTHAYIDEALNARGSSVTVQAEGETNATLSIHLSDMDSKDNHYQLVPDQSVLDAYNKQNGTGFIMLPSDMYSLPSDITIKAGALNADEVKIAIKAFTKDMTDSGESYALPLRLVAKDGSLPAMGTTGAYVITANSIIEFAAPVLNGNTPTTVDMSPGDITVNQFTVEMRFQIKGFSENQALFDGGGSGDSQVYIRLEDPIGTYNLIQIVGKGTYLNAITPFEKNKWQHLAIVFDGSKYLIYVNGKLDAQKDVPAGAVTFSGIKFASSGPAYFRNDCLYNEVRLWGKALNETQIKNNMNSVSVKADGLKAYWKMNDGEGNTFKDYTGNGYNATAAGTIRWIPGILSTDVSTPWQ